LAANEQILNKSFLTSGFFRTCPPGLMTGSVGVFQNQSATADDIECDQGGNNQQIVKSSH
jgi:hypothetical protein